MGSARAVSLRARWWAQAAVFAAVGAANTVIDAGVFAIVVNTLDWSSGSFAMAASALGFVAGSVNSYAWNSRVTFDAGGRDNVHTVSQFAAVTLGGVVLTSLVFAAIEQAGVPSGLVMAKLAAVCAGAAWNFVLMRRWVFANP